MHTCSSPARFPADIYLDRTRRLYVVLNRILDFRDIAVNQLVDVAIYAVGVILFRFSHLVGTGKQLDRWRIRREPKRKRFALAADCAHDDTACVRMLTESGIMLWRHRLVGVISSKSLTECYARNLRPETWRWWLSGCLRKHLFFVPSTG